MNRDLNGFRHHWRPLGGDTSYMINDERTELRRFEICDRCPAVRVTVFSYPALRFVRHEWPESPGQDPIRP